MKCFVSNSDTIKVTIFAFDHNGATDAASAKDQIPKEATEIQELDFVFRAPSYRDSTTILKNAQIRIDGMPMNIMEFQDNILRNLILSWNLKDDEGKDVPVTTAAINSLLPVIARTACSTLMDHVKL